MSREPDMRDIRDVVVELELELAKQECELAALRELVEHIAMGGCIRYLGDKLVPIKGERPRSSAGGETAASDRSRG